jgi:hypothetical protein
MPSPRPGWVCVPAEDAQHGSQMRRRPAQNHAPRTLVITIQAVCPGEPDHETQPGHVAVPHRRDQYKPGSSRWPAHPEPPRRSRSWTRRSPGDSQAQLATAHALASISLAAGQQLWADRALAADRRGGGGVAYCCHRPPIQTRIRVPEPPGSRAATRHHLRDHARQRPMNKIRSYSGGSNRAPAQQSLPERSRSRPVGVTRTRCQAGAPAISSRRRYRCQLPARPGQRWCPGPTDRGT